MAKRNYGKIKFSYDLIDDELELLSFIISKLGFVALYIDNNFMTKNIDYYGYSPFFQEINEGEMVNEYEIIVTKDDNDEVEQIKIQNIDNYNNYERIVYENKEKLQKNKKI